MTPEQVKELVERLTAAYEKVAVYPEHRMRSGAVQELGEGFMDLLALCNLAPKAASALTLLSEEREELQKAAMIGRDAALAIQKATLEGRVCDDVAWFSTIETLHDFCAHTIELIDEAAARSLLPQEGK